MRLTLRRIGAYLIDGAIGFFISMIVIQVPLLLITGFQNTLEPGLPTILWVWLTISPVVWSYFIITEQRHQATIGKRLLNLKVTARDDSNLSPGQAIQRTFFKLLPWEMNHVAFLMTQAQLQTQESVDAAYAVWAGIAYLILFSYIGYTYYMQGRIAPYDLISGTQVQPAA